MYSTMIGKIEKAKRYSEEPERIVFTDFRVTLEGDHRNHVVGYDHGSWTCDCKVIEQSGYCSHTMALERVLGAMIRPEVPEAAGGA